MKVLAIDTSTQAMSVALADYETAGVTVLAEATTYAKIKHSKQLIPLVSALLKSIAWNVDALEVVAVVKGPGSYTGLRIGMTFAKTLAWTLGVPLYTVSALLALAHNATADGAVISFIDARRRTVFGGGFRSVNGILEPLLSERYWDFDALLDAIKDTVPADTPLTFVSPDYPAYADAIQARFGAQATLLTGTAAHIHAASLLELPLTAADPLSAAPVYLKQSEAEEQWQAAHPHETGGHYVERTD